MTIKGIIIVILLSALIGYFIPPIAGLIIMLIAKIKDKCNGKER